MEPRLQLERARARAGVNNAPANSVVINRIHEEQGGGYDGVLSRCVVGDQQARRQCENPINECRIEAAIVFASLLGDVSKEIAIHPREFGGDFVRDFGKACVLLI